MKKRIPALLLAVMLLLALPVTASAAETELRIIGPSQAPAVGESFTVTVEISGNPGMLSGQFTLKYDQDHLTCTKVKQGSVLDDAMFASNPKGSDGARMAAASAEPINGDGVLCDFIFEVTGAVKEYSFEITNAVFSDNEGGKIPVSAISVTISGTPDAPDKPEPVEPEKPEPANPDKPGPTEPDKPEPADPDKPEPTTPETPAFPDVQDHWGAAYIGKAAERGLFTGFEDGTFRPDGTVTRGQFVTVLWRMAGKPAPTEPCPFEDVAADAWYADGVAWAHEKGYVNGRTETTFDPDGSISRQEAMKILFAYNGGASGEELMFYKIYDNDFADSGEIADWAKPAMYWGYYNKIINGKSETTLCPKDTATRAELAKILVVYSEQ